MISKRLSHIIDWVDGKVLADIGCDHGYVCIESIKQNRVDRAYACDIAKGPLSRAQEEVDKNNLNDKIMCLLLDGMVGLPEDVDTIVIAGMGSQTIMDILDKAELKEGMHFLLSPHSQANLLRAYLTSHGFAIHREQYIYEKHYYPIMDCVYTKTNQVLDDFSIRYGYQVEPSKDYQAFIKEQKEKLENLIKMVPSKKDDFERELQVLNKRQ